MANAVPENDGSDKFINSRNPAIKAIFFEHDKVKQELRKSLLEKLTFKPEGITSIIFNTLPLFD